MSALMWIVALFLIVSAVMLVAGVGSSVLWLAVIAIGLATVAITLYRSRHASSHGV